MRCDQRRNWVKSVGLSFSQPLPSTPINGHHQTGPIGPVRAKSGLSNDVGLFAVEGHGRLRAPRSNTRTRWPHRTTRTLSFMAARTTGRGRLPEREWRAFRSIDGTEAVTHSSRGAVGHQPASRGTGFPFKISRRLTALEKLNALRSVESFITPRARCRGSVRRPSSAARIASTAHWLNSAPASRPHRPRPTLA